jgi:hypothetical protein
MEEIIKKEGDNCITVETTETKTEVIDIDNLIAEKESLIGSIENNYNQMVLSNRIMQDQIDKIEAKINKAKELGVKTDSEIQSVITE